ncbi:carbonic anhydrase/acetyltransferase-like protein (isoleucine patch superfamily) [Clostridium saccharoperbutylacetonicum]|uniref:Carbonic anhydrase/acetyltransferase, isoleucine patch superfamily n=1 Tax=Clostridium saccharoperbutylacetonicum N1-4(HMT) TaxID=931276 RepID=M1MAC3_9CLOT|nr:MULTISPECIES: gamma carbonic anhydrase family protein [Clostridium]AGF54894.1 carbonic anhydrase/acetyltransferase, isoleucine patch superfamily [Clostridium saccharoperbutylacetonicum N1-4(HMT)]NRT64401.1 carbonic anhydrase/acetyltransferase-like protein (isoleucine patch superfamily) [Clostridium saccharoperbutylacetonicum]NSB27770.1 carbonic anhydrase/acetyltransferase-like protein (isoleucine patch superfamily) [Clostridium saccharoperbutylacetonicum]NSB41257.1 carbonic anhydrase/acetylt
MIKKFKGKKPNLASEVYVAETAVIIGDVTLERNVNIWFGAVLRGDAASITIGENTNIQDNCVVHVDFDNNVVIGNGCTIGHNAIIHGCSIKDNVLVGMGAIILNGAKIGNDTIIGAGTLITQNKEFEDGVLILGNPGKVIRKLTEEEIEENRKSCKNYIDASKEYKLD